MKTLKIILNGKETTAKPDQTILEVATENGVFIPTLCHSTALEPAAMCRLCMVELTEGRRTKLVTSCNYPLRQDAEIKTDTDAIRRGRKLIIELLMARCPDSEELKKLAGEYGANITRFTPLNDDCVVCGLCARVCEKVGGKTLTLSGRGVHIKVNTAFGEASPYCTGCGACVQICPVNAIKIEDIEDERVITIHGKEAARIKLNHCETCNQYYGPVIDLTKVMERLGEKTIPPPNENLCPTCARQKLAKRIADRYYDVY